MERITSDTVERSGVSQSTITVTCRFANAAKSHPSYWPNPPVSIAAADPEELNASGPLAATACRTDPRRSAAFTDFFPIPSILRATRRKVSIGRREPEVGWWERHFEECRTAPQVPRRPFRASVRIAGQSGQSSVCRIDSPDPRTYS